MKKSGALVALCLVGLCVFGWFSAVLDMFGEASEHSKLLKTADEYVEMGLYQRAIVKYEEAYAEKPSVDIYEDIHAAYKLRMEEAPEVTLDDYMTFLSSAIKDFPDHEEFVNDFFEVYYGKGKYEDAYNGMVKAIEAGYDDDKVKENMRKARYAYDVKGATYWEIKPWADETFTVLNNKGWNLYHSEDGNLFENAYPYLSIECGDYFVVKEENDFRLYDLDGMTWTIFKEEVTDAGIFADGLIPLCIDGKYAYYNDLAEKQFGDYDYAGAFCGGYAAVKSGDSWSIIDTSGDVKEDGFEDIVLDAAGRHCLDKLFVAKKDGEYGIYDAKFKCKADLDCTDADFCGNGGIIAVCVDGKWGYVDSEGETVIEPTFDEARSFSNGLAAVCKDGKWGYVDPEGNIVIDLQFLEAGYVNEYGMFAVKMPVLEEETADGAASENKEETPTDGEGSDQNENHDTWKIAKLKLGIIED